MTELEQIQLKHAQLEYYLKGLQILMALKKEFALAQRLEEKVLGVLKEISPEPAPTIEVRQG